MKLRPALGRPRVDTIEGSSFKNMKELRIQYKGEPWRVLFAFDPHRQAILLVGGNKSGNKRWYKENIPIADQRYQKYLDALGGTVEIIVKIPNKEPIIIGDYSETKCN